MIITLLAVAHPIERGWPAGMVVKYEVKVNLPGGTVASMSAARTLASCWVVLPIYCVPYLMDGRAGRQFQSHRHSLRVSAA